MKYSLPYLIFPIIHGGTGSAFNFQPLMDFLSQFFPIFQAILSSINPFIQIGFGSFTVTADLIPLQVEIVVTVIIPLSIRWMSAVWHVADCIYDEAGYQSAVWIRTDNSFIHALLCSEDHPFGCKCSFLLFAYDSPDLGIAIGIRPLYMH